MKNLISDLKRFKNLPSQERNAFTVCFIYLLKNQLRVWFLGHEIVQEFKRQGDDDYLPHAEYADAELWMQNLERSARKFITRPNCLVQALTACDLLRRQKRPAQIRLLAKRSESGGLAFHAVVYSNDRLIFGQIDEWQNAIELKGSRRAGA